MSFNPVCKPNELAKLKFKDYKPEVAKFIKKMYAKGHTSKDSLVPIFLDVEHTFADGEVAMFIVAGKLNGWKDYIKGALSKESNEVLKGYAFALFSEETGFELKIAPVKGKMRKENVLDRDFKKLVGTKAVLNLLDEMEESDDLENRMENAVDTEDEVLTNSTPLVEDKDTEKTLAISLLKQISSVISQIKQAKTAENVNQLKALAKDLYAIPSWKDFTPDHIEKTITDIALAADALAKRGIAGEQSAAELAKAQRDAKTNEVAFELVRLLNLGRASDTDECFADVIRWAAVASANLQAVETEYTAATEELYQSQSTLGADLRSVFGDTLRGLFVQQMLTDKVSKYASLATALGCLGKTVFARMFSGEKDDAATIYSAYDVDTIKGLLAENKEDVFAKAAYAKLSKQEISQISFLQQLKELRQAINRKKDPIEKQKAQEEANNASDQYLFAIGEKLQAELGLMRLFVSLDEEKLYTELAEWAKTASTKEKMAVSDPNSKFYKYLLNKKGQKEVNLALNIINKPQLDEKDDNYASNEAFFEINKIIITQEARNSVIRWWNERASGEAVQKILLSDNLNNPQEAIVSKFLKNKLAQFVESFPANATPQERQQLQLQKDAILKEAIAKMNEMLDKAYIPQEFKDTIEEAILSNGARGLAYQKLAEYAKQNPNKIATKVLDVLKELDPSSVEWASIKNDIELLQTLKNHIIGWMSGAGKWTMIAKLLGLTGDLADVGIKDKSATKNKFGEQRNSSRSKVITLAEKEKLAEQQSEMRKAPTYWAQAVDFKYEKGFFFKDNFEIIATVIDAQKYSDWDAVQNELKTINVKALDYLIEFMTKYKILSPITPSDLFQVIEKEDGIFTLNSTNVAQLKKVVSKMNSLELLSTCFNLDEVKVKATDLLEKKKQAEEELQQETTDHKKQAARARINTINAEISSVTVDMIKNLDLSADFTKSLNTTLPPNLAFEIKTIIRDKVVGQLAAADQAALKKLLPSFSHEEVKLLVEFIRALSSNEKEAMSRTGVQYRGLTSKGQQRDVAAAVHARLLAKAQNMLNSQTYRKFKRRDKEALLNKLNESLKVFGDEKEKTFKSFEETKKKYDGRIKFGFNFINSVALKFVTIPLENIPFLGKALETAISATVASVLNKALGGDRAGSWKTALATGGKKFALDLAKGLITELAPMLLTATLGEAKLGALEKVGNQLSETLRNYLNSSQQISDGIQFIKNQFNHILQINQLGELIKNAKIRIESFKDLLEEQHGLLGQVTTKIAEGLGEKISEEIEKQVSTFRQKVFKSIAQQSDWINNAYSKIKFAYDCYDFAQSAWEAITSINTKTRLEQFQTENPDLKGDDLVNMLKTMDDFKDLEEHEWKKISSYADMSKKLEDTFNEFVGEKANEWIDPQLDKMLDEEQEQKEEEEETQNPTDKNSEPQLSGKSPKKSLLNLRDALNRQKLAVPELLDELIITL